MRFVLQALAITKRREDMVYTVEETFSDFEEVKAVKGCSFA